MLSIIRSLVTSAASVVFLRHQIEEYDNWSKLISGFTENGEVFKLQQQFFKFICETLFKFSHNSLNFFL